MNEPEAFQLLTLASARDGRTVTQSVAKVWAVDLAWVNLPDAVDALTLHYRESDKWVMPAHIIGGARRVREARERELRKRAALPAGNVITMPANFAEMTQAAIEKYREEQREPV